jgi:lipopolysaccharide biosynthesis protein
MFFGTIMSVWHGLQPDGTNAWLGAWFRAGRWLATANDQPLMLSPSLATATPCQIFLRHCTFFQSTKALAGAHETSRISQARQTTPANYKVASTRFEIRPA